MFFVYLPRLKKQKKMSTIIFRQGDTTNFAIETNQPLGNKKLKIGLFKKNKAVYETVYPDDGVIISID